MRGIKTFTVSALLLCGASAVFGADPDYFPLAVGNSWVYRVTEGRFPDVQVVEVTGTTAVEGHSYFRVNFFGNEALLRTTSDGTLVEYDTGAKREKVWIPFGADAGQTFATEMDNCTKSGKIENKAAKYGGPTGSFTNALQVSFTQSCADAGTQSETFLPYVGLLERVVDNIAGARKYTLVYSRTGVTEVTTPEVRFSLAIDTASATARLTLRNSTSAAIPLVFPSGQSYDLKIRNEKGDVVYTWSADKLFAQIFRTESFGPGERNYAILLPLSTLPAGKYTAEAFLTTSPPGTYTATVAFTL
ncbi:MAG: BsuPI-related putative proteinase inhibitor [Bryobacteraceae bacterium]